MSRINAYSHLRIPKAIQKNFLTVIQDRAQIIIAQTLDIFNNFLKIYTIKFDVNQFATFSFMKFWTVTFSVVNIIYLTSENESNDYNNLFLKFETIKNLKKILLVILNLMPALLTKKV